MRSEKGGERGWRRGEGGGSKLRNAKLLPTITIPLRQPLLQILANSHDEFFAPTQSHFRCHDRQLVETFQPAIHAYRSGLTGYVVASARTMNNLTVS